MNYGRSQLFIYLKIMGYGNGTDAVLRTRTSNGRCSQLAHRNADCERERLALSENCIYNIATSTRTRSYHFYSISATTLSDAKSVMYHRRQLAYHNVSHPNTTFCHTMTMNYVIYKYILIHNIKYALFNISTRQHCSHTHLRVQY